MKMLIAFRGKITLFLTGCSCYCILYMVAVQNHRNILFVSVVVGYLPRKDIRNEI